MSTYLAIVTYVKPEKNALGFSYVDGTQNIGVGLNGFEHLKLKKGDRILVTTDDPNIGGVVNNITLFTDTSFKKPKQD